MAGCTLGATIQAAGAAAVLRFGASIRDGTETSYPGSLQGTLMRTGWRSSFPREHSLRPRLIEDLRVALPTDCFVACRIFSPCL